MTMNEGSKVVYVGDDPRVGVGTVGQILAHADSASSHVQWAGGDRSGAVDVISHEELIPHRTHGTKATQSHASAGFEDSLEHQALLRFAVRETYDNYGEDGVINALSETGTLASLAPLAGDVIGAIGSKLRQDPEFSLVLAQLDDQEADGLLVRVAVALLQTEEE